LQDPKAVFAIASLWGYFGASPADGSAMYFAYAIMSYFTEDIYYIKGGFQTLADTFVKRIESLGGEVCLKNEVKKIVVEDKAVKGIHLETGEYVEAPMIISNSDLTKMMHELVGAQHFPSRYLKRISKLSVSMSAFEVFIGTDLPLHEMDLAHEVFVYDRYDYSEVYNNLANLKELGVEGVSGVAISCPSLADPNLAPEGKHTVVITTLMPYDIGDWKEMKPKFQDALIRLAETAIPNLSQHLDFVESGTPLTMERYTNNTRGAIYGFTQNLEQSTGRPQPETPIKGLYLTGHWTELGGGVVSVLLSAHKLHQKLKDKAMAAAAESEVAVGASEEQA
jgi:prolycopene isomerase